MQTLAPLLLGLNQIPTNEKTKNPFRLEFDIKNGEIGTWINTTRSVLCQQVIETSAYWGGRDGILYHLKQNLNWDKNKPKVTIVESDEILEKYQTRFEDSITSISGSVSKVLELH